MWCDFPLCIHVCAVGFFFQSQTIDRSTFVTKAIPMRARHFFYFSLFIKIYKQTKWCRWLFTSNTKTNHMKSEWKKMQWIKNELVCGLERVILRKWARNFCLLWIWFSFLRKWQHTLISFLRPFDGIITININLFILKITCCFLMIKYS